MLKTCSKCKQQKELESFHFGKNYKDGRQSRCKACSKIARKSWAIENREHVNEMARKWAMNHPEEKKLRDRIYSFSHREEARKRSREHYYKNREEKLKYARFYRQKEDFKQKRNLIHRERYGTDPTYKLLYILRNRLRKVVTGRRKRTKDLVGCSLEELRSHLENLFKDGMSWENHGEWHIDHIRPCVSFDLSKSEEQARCFNFSNLQPLWAKENLSKYTSLV